MIRLTRVTLDHTTEHRTYRGLAAARRWALDCVGPTPEITETYAISPDGVVTLYAEGCSLSHLFPAASRTATGARHARITELDDALRAETPTSIYCGCQIRNEHYYHLLAVRNRFADMTDAQYDAHIASGQPLWLPDPNQ